MVSAQPPANPTVVVWCIFRHGRKHELLTVLVIYLAWNVKFVTWNVKFIGRNAKFAFKDD